MAITAADVWTDPDTPAVCLVALLIHQLGTESLTWSTDTIRAEIAHENNNTEIAPRNLDRLMGALVVMTRPDEFYNYVASFHTLSSAIAGPWFDPSTAEQPILEDQLWAIIEAHMLDPGDTEESNNIEDKNENKSRFSPEVTRYVNMVAREEGYRRLPPIITAYGIQRDPYVWNATDVNDYSLADDLGPGITAAADDREHDLTLDIVDKVRDTAARIAAMSEILKHGGPQAASEILLKSIGARR